MLRLKNKLNQVVVGDDYASPLDCEISNVWTSKEETKGKVKLKGKKYPVTHIGGGVWVLNNGLSIRSIYPESNEKRAVS